MIKFWLIGSLCVLLAGSVVFLTVREIDSLTEPFVREKQREEKIKKNCRDSIERYRVLYKDRPVEEWQEGHREEYRAYKNILASYGE